jgi:hypothetical protein
MWFLAALERPRQWHRLGVPFSGKRFNRRPARIAKPHRLGGFVEGFPGGIVDGRGKAAIIADAAYLEQLAMPAAGKQQEVGKIEGGIDQPRAKRMPLKVINCDQRLACGEAQSFADKQANHDAADQPGACRRGNRIDVANRHISFVQHLPHQPGQDLDMCARRDLRNDATKRAMCFVLPDHRLGKDLAVARHQRRGTVVARRFKGKDQRHQQCPLPHDSGLR